MIQKILRDNYRNRIIFYLFLILFFSSFSGSEASASPDVSFNYGICDSTSLSSKCSIENMKTSETTLQNIPQEKNGNKPFEVNHSDGQIVFA